MKKIFNVIIILLLLVSFAQPSFAACDSSFSNHPTLGIGISGTHVRSLQEVINSVLGESLGIDGFFGRRTRAAVISFQNLVGLEPDGVVGKKTYKALAERCENVDITESEEKQFFTHEVKKFATRAEFSNFIEKYTSGKNAYRGNVILEEAAVIVADSNVPMAGVQTKSSVGSSDFSTTNIQEIGVDEADIVKTDGSYIYAVSGDEIVVVDVREKDSMNIISRVSYNGNPQDLYLSGDTLVVIGRNYEKLTKKQATSGTSTRIWYPRQTLFTSVSFYDISDGSAKLEKNYEMEGNLVSSRLTGGELYIINEKHMYNTALPFVREDGRKMILPFDIAYFDMPYHNTRLTQIYGINVKNPNEIDISQYLLSGNQTMYVSQENIYISYQDNSMYWPVFRETDSAVDVLPEQEGEKTIIHRIEINKGKSSLDASGSVPGRVLNQFSMDEDDGFLRVATTSGNNWNGDNSRNNVYVLDKDMDIVGSIEGLAPGERIYSARFMGNTAYMVTFKQIDPLFVIDLSNPRKPRVKGELKIPGFSNYLHPYDENTLLGIGRDVEVYDNGRITTRGVKVALFDVSDVNKPHEIDSYIIGDNRSSSEALHNHKAVLFSKEKNLLVIPYNNYSDTESQFNGAAVFFVDKDSGIKLRGKISHYMTGDGNHWQKSIKRTLYIDDVLYSLSQRFLQSNDLNSLEKINQIKLSEEKYDDYPIPAIAIDEELAF